MERFALSQFTTPLSFEEDIDLCRELGISGIELCENKLSDDRDTSIRQLKAVSDAGLKVCSVQARVHAVFPDQMSPQPTDPSKRIDAMMRTMDVIAEALPDEDPSFVLISGKAPDHNIAAARDTLRETATRLAGEAASRGARIAFESLHPVMMNTDTFVYSWEGAAALSRSVGCDSFGLVCDVWNVWDQHDILERVRNEIRSVSIFHMSDWRGSGPRCLNDRLPPGQGVIQFDHWGRLLKETHYEKWIALEMLSDPKLDDSYLHKPMSLVVDEARRFLRAAGCLDDSPVISAG